MTGVLYKSSDDQEHIATANLTVVCDGMHSTLRKKLGTPDLRTPSHFVGLKLKGCSLPYSNFGHVVLANPSPLLFYPISSTEVQTLAESLAFAQSWSYPFPYLLRDTIMVCIMVVPCTTIICQRLKKRS